MCARRWGGLGADFAGDGLGGEILFVDLVFPQLVADAQAVEDARGVGLHKVGSSRRRRTGKAEPIFARSSSLNFSFSAPAFSSV